MNQEFVKKATEEQAILHLAKNTLPEKYPYGHVFEEEVK